MSRPADARRRAADAGRRATLVALTALLTVLACTGLAELVLRVARPQAAGVSRLPPLYASDLRIGFRYRPGASGRLQRLFEIDRTVRINALGRHDVTRPPGSAGPRILALGDSFTAALQVAPEESWPQVLERELRAGADPAEVWNLGLDGTGTDVHVELLREQLEAGVAPHAVILAFFANDVADVARGPVTREVRGGYVLQPIGEAQAEAMRALADRMNGRRIAGALFEHSYLARVAVYLRAGDRNLFRTNVIGPSHLGLAPPPLDARAAAVGMREALHALATLSDAHGFRLWVVPVPGRDEPDASARALAAYTRGASAKSVVDPLPTMRALLAAAGGDWSDLHWRFDGHFTALGHEVFARAIARELMRADFASPPRALAPRLAASPHRRAW